MTNHNESDSLAINVQLALEDASHRVIERAQLAKTKVIIWRDGTIVRLTPDEAEQELAANLAKQATSQS